MTTNHRYYLDLAFHIAEKNLGKTKLNPSVGTIIVKNNSIISSGITSVNGRPHSEFNALNKKINFEGADLYTTLEPCTHYGLTQPCVNIIIKKKIKNVFYGFDDPDIRTYRKAKKILKKKKIKITKIKTKKFNNFYASYFINKKLNIPFISAKIAISKDYYSINKISKWITGDHSRKIAHLLRSQNDCIFSTSKTINNDNALLNNRINGLNNFKPDLFIIDLDLKLKRNLLINKILNRRKTFLITRKNNEKKIRFYEKKGFKIMYINSLDTKEHIIKMFRMVFRYGYRRFFFETGLTFLNSLITHNLVDNLYIFKSNFKLKKKGFNNSSNQFLKKIKLNKQIIVNLVHDKLYKIEF